MTALLSSTVQPPILTLLSSTSQPALSPLFTSHIDPSCPSKSIITSLPDILTRPRAAKRKWDAQPDERSFVPTHKAERGDVEDIVVHVQGPAIADTYIQAGSSATARKKGGEGVPLPLGLELPRVHFQLKRLGSRGFALEVGVLDLKGREGVIRCSTFQKTPSIHPHRQPPLIHLPLALPAQTASTMTQWLDISLNISSLLPLFQTMPRTAPEDGTKRRKREEGMPNGQFGSVSYVRVYANCRVRRVWFSEAGERTMRNIDSRDFALHAAQAP
ncbi:uncharacterized protein MKK02DRAFT_38810 [Dioszegia hungarica]|uniref:CFA20 domain-containing protein n=1 Tax=Dioszegia hungarica TaxID=4972 RepID=A0AA38LSZ8_9TREE|nr:uncharacterized protein MKK02DRAFT_38810 [Dioszegia hungarica]KAI9634138.1 hypothetical protein MKK02DRAFT_38810 [Dioszegia hungarica]